ncbi:MAG: glycosyltransferase [Patescibacteria group bacterium]|nr:glycosyltransferase [Patescibacteria group bacterium]
MSNITFVLFARNEEKRILYAIRNLKNYGAVIVLDGGSTDQTKELCEKAGAQFVLRPFSDKPQVETQENFEFIKRKIQTDWIYWGYVDNLAPKSLLEKLTEISMQNKVKMVLIPLYTYLWGNTRHYAHKGYSPFFYHKDFMDYSQNNIHGMGKFLGTKKQILKLPDKEEFALKHFSVYNIGKFVGSHWRYAEEEALEKYRRGKKFSVLRMLAGMIRYWWIYRKSLKNGSLGLIIVLSYSFFRLMSYARLYELERGISLESIEGNYSVLKEKMLKDFD